MYTIKTEFYQLHFMFESVALMVAAMARGNEIGR
jgi:hypothetical protein